MSTWFFIKKVRKIKIKYKNTVSYEIKKIKIIKKIKRKINTVSSKINFINIIRKKK